MAEVDVVVAGRTYRLGCEDGQEGHLAALAAALDAEARSLAARTGTIGEGRLLVMTALMVADRLHEATEALAVGKPTAAAPDAGLAEALDRLEALLDADEADDASRGH